MSKVAVIRCESYDKNEVYTAVKRGVELLGGINQILGDVIKPLLKPNLLLGKNPEKQVTTNPSIFEAVSRLMVESGYKNLSYGDSPGFGAPEKVARQCGYSDIADKYNLKFAAFTDCETISYPDGKVCKQFDIAKGVLDSDCIISLSKMKTHGLCRITGAVKNQLGCVAGLNKGAFHAKYPDGLSFSEMLVDLNRYLKPRLFVMDGVWAMEGNGPSSGDPRKMNVILISTDPVALDTVFCQMINMDPTFVPTITFGAAAGLGVTGAEVECVGDPVTDFVQPDYKVTRLPIKKENPGRLVKSLRNFFLRKPYILSEKCIKCGICVEACPLKEKAIGFEGGSKSRPPRYFYKKCIRCYCCQEMCPQSAIEVKTPLLGKLVLYR